MPAQFHFASCGQEMSLKDETAQVRVARFHGSCSSDERAEHYLTNLDAKELQELRESARVVAGSLLRRHRKVRQFILQIDQWIDVTNRFQESLWGQR
jgi:hypothetical protein